MFRKAYIIVDNDHPLFPQEAIAEIDIRSRQIIDGIEKQQSIKLPTIRFELRQGRKGRRRASSVVGTFFGTAEHPDVRVILADEPIAPSVLRKPFASNELLVVLEEQTRALSISFQPGTGGAKCRVTLPRSRLRRLVEDVIVDVTLGSFFRQTEPLSTLIEQEGMARLFAKKVAFARTLPLSEIQVSKRAGYVTFASLAGGDDTIAERAEEAFRIWRAFSEWNTLGAHLGVTATENAEPRSQLFEQVPKLGRQLPLARIRTVVEALPDGSYVMAVLRSASTVRKSPSLRNQISTIFGPRARQNKFVIFGQQTYLQSQVTLSDLSSSGHLLTIPFSIQDNQVLRSS